MTTSRRDLLSGIFGFFIATAAARSLAHAQDAALRFADPEPFSPDLVREQARALAAEPFGAHDVPLPDVLAQLNYDQQRDIRFRRDMALWHGLGLDSEVQFFHLGYHFKTPVHIYEVADGMARLRSALESFASVR